MYILFEEHQYESHEVETILKDIYVLQDVNKAVSVQYVGYFYNPHLHDCVFILPKVLLDEKEHLVGVRQGTGEPVTPEMVLTPKGQEKLSKEYRKFIYEFSVWIYRALNVFFKANPRSKAILCKHLPQVGKGRKHQAKTYLDIVLSLINFNKENRDFVLFTIKNLHRGNNKINWTRTISHSQAIVQGNDVVYLNPVNKKRVVNYEEELFVIFYSILNYLNDAYGFRTPINIQYELITGKQFGLYLRGMGKTRLRQIKYKYYSDKALLLWDLCYAFFEKSYRIAINTNAQEYLLAKSFNIVFEAMIDELIGTPHNDIPKGLADQDDGKRVDHIYTDLALTSTDEQSKREVYYIGDSKYYKRGNPLTSESIYKQYTYARNVIQWNINLFLDEDEAYDNEDRNRRREDFKKFGNIQLQDTNGTEGYDVIPNFFIRAFVDGQLRYNDGKNIRKYEDDGKPCTTVSYQFKDRLFDRDTLFLSQYDVNFLYVLFLYARNKANEKAHWKQDVRKIFREEIRGVIDGKFQIYAMRARQGINGPLYIRHHFYELNGRVFKPYGKDRQMYFAYARPKEHLEETKEQYEELGKYFLIKECKMGKDPEETLKKEIEEECRETVIPQKMLTLHYVENYPNEVFLVGGFREEQKEWMFGRKGGKVDDAYNIRLGIDVEGGVKRTDTLKQAKFVLLYEYDKEHEGVYKAFRVKGYQEKTKDDLIREGYPSPNHDRYYCYIFDEEVNLGTYDIERIISTDRINYSTEIRQSRSLTKEYPEGRPIFVKGDELLEFRKSL